MTTAIEREEQVRESHVSIGQAEVTVLESDGGFSVFVADQVPAGFVEIHDGIPAAGLIDPTTDEPSHSIHVDEEGKLVLSSYSDGEPANVVRMRGAVLEAEEPTTVKAGRAHVYIGEVKEDGLPTVIISVDGRPVVGVTCHDGGIVANLLKADGCPTHSLLQLASGEVAVMKHGDGKPLVVPCCAAIGQN